MRKTKSNIYVGIINNINKQFKCIKIKHATKKSLHLKHIFLKLI